jgi:hypothetical protein
MTWRKAAGLALGVTELPLSSVSPIRTVASSFRALVIIRKLNDKIYPSGNMNG